MRLARRYDEFLLPANNATLAGVLGLFRSLLVPALQAEYPTVLSDFDRQRDFMDGVLAGHQTQTQQGVLK